MAALCERNMNTDRITEFVSFVNDDVDAAVQELDGINSDSNRKHLQRLVYTNLADRFDSMVDHALLDNATEEPLLTEAIDKFTEPLPEGKLLKLLSMPDTSKYVEQRAQDYVRESVLRRRHSQKLEKLLSLFCPDINTVNKPRVNINTGKIAATFKPPNNKIPSSICGYADWLYSRRNSVVHGAGGTKLLPNDVAKLKAIYKANPALTVKISIGSITTASQFYYSVTYLLTNT